MAILLCKLHDRFEQIPHYGTIDQKRLYEITILANAFGYTDILRPWAQNWLHNIGPGESTLAWECALGVASALDDLTVLKDAARRSALYSAPRNQLAAKLYLTDRRSVWIFFQPGSNFDPQTMKPVEWTPVDTASSGTSHRARQAPQRRR